ncbi:unnamed protein product [Caenorhabditis auriculariae]|uniref:V-type proton ATPase subunit a n=1 Tax=Caenorhabditis auriculariae TaxID=2777116 RepID=A0A8S1H7F7_9PELO|nr:unnamed protein product [Caenorhabditis auriculariae]
MNSEVPLSFDNAVYDANSQEKIFDVHEPLENHSRNSFHSVTQNTSRARVPRYYLPPTPRVTFSINSEVRRQSFPRAADWVRNVRRTPFRRPRSHQDDEALIEEEDLDYSGNSQGYRFFATNFPSRTSSRGTQPFLALSRQLRDRFSAFVNFRSNEEDESPVEVARGNNEQINLSEIFGSPAETRSTPAVEQFVLASSASAKRFSLFSAVKKAIKSANQWVGSHFEMGSLHRSEEMRLCQMILVKEAAYECIAEMGKCSNVQFIDLNADISTYARTFVNQIRRCEELERKLRFLERQVIDCVPEIIPQPIDFGCLDAPTMAEIMQLEIRLDQLEREFLELNSNDCQLRKNLNQSLEFQQVLERVEQFFQVHMEDEAMQKIEATDEMGQPKSMAGANGVEQMPLTPLLPEEASHNAWFVAGVLPLDKKLSFERVLWRACRRTAFVRTSDMHFVLENPSTLEPVEKCVFIVFFKGESLRQIVDKVCDGFYATQYPCPKTSKERRMTLAETEGRISDLRIVIDSTQTHRYLILKDLSKELPKWLRSIQIQKSIFQIMNMCTVDTNGFLAAECWIPQKEMDNVRHALHDGFKASGTEVSPLLNQVLPNAPPPTRHQTNKFTRVFQSIVDSYGIGTYREVNPAPYTIITFPFLFAVMFGDAAHGLVLFLIALFFVWNEKKIETKRIRDEIFNTFFGGRYIMLLMGLFSIYTGMIYNDAFAKSVNVFGSSWRNPYNETQLDWWEARQIRKRRTYLLEFSPIQAFDTERGPYPFGVDPIWNIAENRLNFLNSMKMKASVIIGIAQMTFGVYLSFLNHRFFKSYIDIFTNFIPQIIFLSSIFIYLCVQIVVKWVFFSANPGVVLGFEYPGSFCAPSLLIGLINMFMLKERPVGFLENGKQHPTCYLNQWYPYQELVERVLYGVAIFCVPVMLLGKPLWIYFTSRKIDRRRHASGNKSNGASNGGQLEDVEFLVADDLDLAEDVHHTMSDVVVHQAIHTIEFVLGCVSHTASYLRLWALSLAHAQLSEVLWHMVLIKGLNITDHPYLSPVCCFLTFFVFAILSLSILIMMEGLSAFLHALRLHWVEFQSKFYMGTGHPFTAFYLRDCLENAQLVTEEADRLAEVQRRTAENSS